MAKNDKKKVTPCNLFQVFTNGFECCLNPHNAQAQRLRPMNLAGSPEASLLADLLRCGHVLNYDATLDLSPALVRVVRSARKGDIRDLNFDSKLIVQGLRGVYISAYGGGEPFYTTKQKSEIRIFLRIIVRLPEFVESTAKFFFDHVLVDVVLVGW